jgi:hypothetical protein
MKSLLLDKKQKYFKHKGHEGHKGFKVLLRVLCVLRVKVLLGFGLSELGI